ncbi:MAG: outer membrane protein transport protein [Thermoanaerobaculia bacterium]
MRQRHPATLPRMFLAAAAAVGFLTSSPAYPSGFQVMSQGAKASGMGLAFAGIADDPSAIFYNPAGLGWQKHFELYTGGALLTRTDGGVTGLNPYPGEGVTETIEKQWFLLPNVYAVVPLTGELNFGLGIFSQYGLGLRWNNPERWSGRFISQNAVIKTVDLNPVFSYQLFPQLAIAAGADVRFSKVQLERIQGAVDPFTGAFENVAKIKLNSDLLSNKGWGWNVGVMAKPFEALSIGAAYRSHIKVDYEGTAQFIQRPTGNPVFDSLVAAQLPTGEPPVQTSIDFPASINIGAGIHLPGGFLLGLEADWTQWSKFHDLNIVFPTLVGRDFDRITLWQDSWAYRVGVEKTFGPWAVRVGYYYDNTPQPTFDTGPLLSDNDRNVYSAGIGYNTEQFGLDVGALLIKFRNRTVPPPMQTDQYFGVYSETALVLVGGLRVAF